MQHITIISVVILFASCSKSGGELPPENLNATFHHEGATGIILIDFDGGTLQGDDWPIRSYFKVGLGYEQQKTIFDTIIGDFCLFKMAITTNEDTFRVSVAALKLRIIVTTTDEWTGPKEGGIAAMGGIKYGIPGFVFPRRLGYNPSLIAHTIAHEVGHSFGLKHQQQRQAIMSQLPSDCKIWVSGYNEDGQWQNDTAMIQSVLNN